MAYALGEVGLRPQEFWEMSWPEYEHACRGYELRQVREWERTRQLGVWIAHFQDVKTKSGKHLTGPDLMKLFTDDSNQNTPTETHDEFLARMAANNYFRTPKARA